MKCINLYSTDFKKNFEASYLAKLITAENRSYFCVQNELNTAEKQMLIDMYVQTSEHQRDP